MGIDATEYRRDDLQAGWKPLNSTMVGGRYGLPYRLCLQKDAKEASDWALRATTGKYYNEVDRFGFSSILNYKINKRFEWRRSFCSWVHGWKWFNVDSPLQLGFNEYAYKSLVGRRKNAVVGNQTQKELLESYGFKNVVIGGIPSVYLRDVVVPGMQRNRYHDKGIERDTVVILPKCQSQAPDRASLKSLVEYVNDDRGLRERCILCVYAQDIARESIQEIISKQELPFIIGAHPYDQYSLVRTHQLFLTFNYYITNTIGTHIPQLASMGKSVSFIDEIYDERSEADLEPLFKGVMDKEDLRSLFERQCYVHSKEYLRSRLSFLSDPEFWRNEAIVWGQKEMGVQNVLSNDQLCSVLGWTLTEAAKQLILGGAYKLERQLFLGKKGDYISKE